MTVTNRREGWPSHTVAAGCRFSLLSPEEARLALPAIRVGFFLSPCLPWVHTYSTDHDLPFMEPREQTPHQFLIMVGWLGLYFSPFCSSITIQLVDHLYVDNTTSWDIISIGHIFMCVLIIFCNAIFVTLDTDLWCVTISHSMNGYTTWVLLSYVFLLIHCSILGFGGLSVRFHGTIHRTLLYSLVAMATLLIYLLTKVRTFTCF